jgi:hypothetical protein
VLPHDENAVVWSVRLPVLNFFGAVELLADDTYQVSMVDRSREEWVAFLPAEKTLPDAIEFLQRVVDGVVDEYATRQRIDFRSQAA